MGPGAGNTSNCEQCGESFVAKRKDARFCGETCRWTNWKAKKENGGNKTTGVETHKEMVSNSLLKSLHGIVSDEPQYEEKETKTTNLAWSDTIKQKGRLIKEREGIRRTLNDLRQKEHDIKSETGDWMIFTGMLSGAVGGGLVGNGIDNATKANDTINGKDKKNKPKEKSKKRESNSGTFIGVLLGTALGGLIGNGIQNATKEDREAKKKKAIEELQSKINRYKEQLVKYDSAILDITAKADTMPKWIITKEQVLIAPPDTRNPVFGTL